MVPSLFRIKGATTIPAPVRGALWMLFSASSFAVVSATVRHLAGKSEAKRS